MGLKSAVSKEKGVLQNEELNLSLPKFEVNGWLRIEVFFFFLFKDKRIGKLLIECNLGERGRGCLVNRNCIVDFQEKY